MSCVDTVRNETVSLVRSIKKQKIQYGQAVHLPHILIRRRSRPVSSLQKIPRITKFRDTRPHHDLPGRVIKPKIANIRGAPIATPLIGSKELCPRGGRMDARREDDVAGVRVVGPGHAVACGLVDDLDVVDQGIRVVCGTVPVQA